jgi:uncharacterized membrane protein
MRIVSVGHVVFAATLIAFGVLGVVRGDFTQIWAPVPKALPGRELMAYLCALVCLASGLGLFWRRTATVAARVLLAYLVLWALAFKARFIAIAPLQEGVYQSLGENVVLIAGAWVLYAWFAADWDRQRLGFATGARGVRIARALYALALIAFGLSHFFYLNMTAPLVPAWLPWHTGWAYFTGAAYLAAALAVLVGVFARLAAALSALMMGVFTVLVWAPLALAGTISASQWGEFLVSWALTAAAWVVADSYRDAPWLAPKPALARAA